MSDFVKSTSGAAGQKACLTNGLTIITGGAGIADMTLAAPQPGHRAAIRLLSVDALASVVVTTATGTTLDGTNTVATFDTAEQVLILVYKDAVTWAIEKNIGSVTLS